MFSAVESGGRRRLFISARTVKWHLDDTDELLRTENTAVGFFNATIERYPDHLGRTVLWVSARALYGVREHPAEDVGKIILASWL